MKPSERGFSLIEVLVALLIFTVGLLGMAGLLVVSVKTNHSAYQRTQASFLAQAMADRMRGNSRAMWSGTYNDSYDGSAGTGGATCTEAAPCGFEDVAARDKQSFNDGLRQFLPNPNATVNCVAQAAAPADTGGRPPFDGLCAIVITWSEQGLARETQAPSDQTFAWKFQP